MSEEPLLPVQGSGGGKGGGHTPSEAANSLFSNAQGAVVDLLSEGEIQGLVGGNAGIFYNETALQPVGGTLNFKGVMIEANNGLSDQPSLAGFDNIKTTVSVVQALPYNTYKTISFPNDGTITAVDVTISTDQFFEVSSDGDVTGTSVTFNIEKSENGGAFAVIINGNLSGKQNDTYDVDYRVPIENTAGTTAIRVIRTKADATNLNIHDLISFKYYTKVVEHKLTYPNRAVVGHRFDAKQFGNQLPSRAYHIKGIKCSVPANYDPVQRTYTGAFTGALSSTKQWTNNPAWVLYDLITSTRYGLGQYFDTTLVDLTSLYTLGKWCDDMVSDGMSVAQTVTALTFASGTATATVANHGFVTGNYVLIAGAAQSAYNGAFNVTVTDANTFTYPVSGTPVTPATGTITAQKREPRWTCNAYITNREEAFNVLKNIASIFRGVLFWMDGKLWAQADNPKTAVKLVTNANVIDGTFTYSGESNRSRASVVNVAWNDPVIFYRRAIETYENPTLIREFGWKPMDVQGIGCTSRAQARRLAKAILYSQENESELVTYKASFDHMAVSADNSTTVGIAPGDLIYISDFTRGDAVAGGRITTVNSTTSFSVVDQDGSTVDWGTGAGGTVYLEHAATGDVEWVACTWSGNTVTLSATPTEPLATNDLFILTSSGQSVETFRIIKVAEVERNILEVSAAKYNSGKFNAIYGEDTFDVSNIMRVGVASFIAAPASITFTELYTVNTDKSSRVLQVAWPPVTDQYLDFYEVTYARNNATPVKVQVSGRTYSIPDIVAATYQVSIRAVNKMGVYSLPVTNTYTAALTPAGYSLGSISNIALQSGGTTFSGKDAPFTWQISSPTATYLNAQGTTVNSGFTDPKFRDCVVYVKNGATLLRTENVIDNRYTYTYEKNFADTAGTPTRSFNIEVTYRDIYGRESAHVAGPTVSNPAPATPTGTISTNYTGLIQIVFDPPTDPDFEGTVVWLSTTNGFTPNDATNKVWKGKGNVNLSGYSPGTYYLIFAHYDSYGSTGLNQSTQQTVTVPTQGTWSGSIAWGNVSSRPIELTDGRVSAGLSATNGYIDFNRAHLNKTLDYVSDGTSYARIAAGNVSGGAHLWSGLSSRPLELTDGRVSTAIASGGQIQSAAIGDANRVRFSQFERGTLGWQTGDQTVGLTPTLSVATIGGINYYKNVTSFTANSQQIGIGTDTSVNGVIIPCVAGERLFVSAMLALGTAYPAAGTWALYVGWLNSSNAEIGARASVASGNGSMATATRQGGFCTPPTGAVGCFIRFNAANNTGGAVANVDIYLGQMMVCSAGANQTSWPAFSPGPFGDYGATLGADWGNNLTTRPIELTDGRVSAGLSATNGYIDFSRSHLNKNIDNVADGVSYARIAAGNVSAGAHLWSGLSSRPVELTDGRVSAGLSATNGYIDFSRAHVNKNIDNVADGTSYGRTLATYLNANRPVVDFSATYHTNKNVDNIADGGTYGRTVNTYLNSNRPVVNFADTFHSNQGLVNNSNAAIGTNLLFNSEFTLVDPAYYTSTYPTGFVQPWNGNNSTPPTPSDATVIMGDGSLGAGRTFTGTVAMTSGSVVDGLSSYNLGNAASGRRYMIPVKPGDVLAVSALIAHQNCSGAYVEAQWQDETFATSGEQAGGTVTYDIGATAFTAVNRKDMALATFVVTVPADGAAPVIGTSRRRWVWFNVRYISNGVGYPRCLTAAPMIAKLPPGQTAVPPYVPGPSDRQATYGADWAGNLNSRPLELTDGRVSAGLSATNGYIDFSRAHVNKTIDNVADGATYGRTVASDLTTNRVDFSKALLNKHLDNIPDGTTYGRVKAAGLASGQVTRAGVAVQFQGGQNLLLNPLGRLGLQNWTASNPGVSFAAQNMGSGFSSRFGASGNSGTQFLDQTIVPAGVNQQMTLSGFLEPGGISGVAIQIINFSTSTVLASAQAQGYFAITATFANTTDQYRVRMVWPGAASGAAYWYQLKLENGTIATPFSDDMATSMIPITHNMTAAGSGLDVLYDGGTYGKTRLSAMLGSVPLQLVGDKGSLPNGSFISNMVGTPTGQLSTAAGTLVSDGWKIASADPVWQCFYEQPSNATADIVMRLGYNSIAAGASQNFYIQSTTIIPVRPGDNFYLSAVRDCNNNIAIAAGFTVTSLAYVAFYYANGTVISTVQTSNLVGNSVAKQATGSSIPSTVPTGAAYAVVYLQGQITNGNASAGPAATSGAPADIRFYNVQFVIGSNLDSEIIDGSTYQRMPSANMDGNRRGLVDFSQAGHLNKTQDNVADGTTYARLLASQTTSGQHKLEISGSGHKLGDARQLPPIVTAGAGYYYNKAPTWTCDASGNVAVSLAAGSLIMGSTSVAYNAMSATTFLAPGNTLTYNLYVDDAGYTGGTQTLVIGNSNSAPYLSDARIFMGQVTVTSNATATSGGGTAGGHGGFTCVWEDAWVETGRGWIKARNVRVGDFVCVLDYDTMNSLRWEPVTANIAAENDGWEITTHDDTATLYLSGETPLTLKDGSSIFPHELNGHELPVKLCEKMEWVSCFARPLNGSIRVAKISCNGCTYAAGNEVGKAILTHNVIKQ